jgi:hypothetical protein
MLNEGCFHLGNAKCTQLSGSLNNDQKHHGKQIDIVLFLKHFEQVLLGKRDLELDAEYESKERVPRIKIRVQEIYTSLC